MSRFGNKAKTSTSTSQPKAAAPMRKKSIFGGITKPKGSRPSNYFTPGRYRLKVTQILVGVSENPDHKNEDFGRAAFEVLASEPPTQPAHDGSSPQPVGVEMSMTKYFAGKACDFRLAEWRNLMCAILEIDENDVDWDQLTEEEVAEFEAACDHVAENPDEYLGVEVECNCYEKYNQKSDRWFTQTDFSIAG